ncbi:hypothetical protein CPB85DRAFT_982308 [Mucidula mucida]|nr:hypothetical protein CPB85DRAFT_982308 [Mucidula mucida]
MFRDLGVSMLRDKLRCAGVCWKDERRRRRFIWAPLFDGQSCLESTRGKCALTKAANNGNKRAFAGLLFYERRVTEQSRGMMVCHQGPLSGATNRHLRAFCSLGLVLNGLVVLGGFLFLLLLAGLNVRVSFMPKSVLPDPVLRGLAAHCGSVHFEFEFLRLNLDLPVHLPCFCATHVGNLSFVAGGVKSVTLWLDS